MSSADWFRGLAESEIANQEREVLRRKTPNNMRKTTILKSMSGGMTMPPSVTCITSFALILSFLMLICTYLLLDPATLMRAVVCDGDVHADSTDMRLSTDPEAPATLDNVTKISILLGILMPISKVERRSLLRIAYGVQQLHSPIADVAVRFAVGKPKNEKEATAISLESLHHGDIIYLDCDENMNAGKSFHFFSTVAGSPNSRYDYVMKLDDDSYVRAENLAHSLFDLPRHDLYYGYVLPCSNQDPHAWYMAGMGYVLSWDLVQWVSESPIPRNRTVGTEDKLMGDWLNEGKKAKNRVSKKPLFYDHPEFGGACSHELVAESILVHQVKTPDLWLNVLNFFEGSRLSTFAQPRIGLAT